MRHELRRSTERIRAVQLARAKVAVLAKLERRWQSLIPGGRLTREARRAALKTPELKALARKWIRDGNVLSLTDALLRPDPERMRSELGIDPAAFVCTDCGEPVPLGQGRCSDCADWAREHGEP